MTDESTVKPDIVLTLDSDGVIRGVEPSRALENESLDGWRGQSWSDTLPSTLVGAVSKAMEGSRHKGQSVCFRAKQRLPSGRQLALEYTTISLGRNAGFIAVGRDIQSVSDLKARLVDTQRAHQQDFWKLREIESRYRAVLDASNEAVALVRASTMRVVEANATAVRKLGLVPGADLLVELSPRDRRALDASIEIARSQGRAPSIVLHLPDASQWGFRASIIPSEADLFFLIQMSPLQDPPDTEAEFTGLAQILSRFPDGFVLVDRDGTIRKANGVFLDLIQAGVENTVLGQNLSRWLSHPGEDFAAIAGLINRHGCVRLLRCRIEGELGTVTNVEISAAGDRATAPRVYGLFVRDATSRDARNEDSHFAAATLPLVDEAVVLRGSLDETVKAAVEAVEIKCIKDALTKTSGNRTLAARALRLSRQTLHVKLNKYNLDKI